MPLEINSLISLLDLSKGQKTICLFGDSGDGKTTDIGELAEHLYIYGRNAAGKPLRTRLYTADEGGIDSIRPYIDDFGIIEPVFLGGRPEPWQWLDAIVKGQVLSATGQWIAGQNDDIGLWGFESMTSMGEALRLALGLSGERLELKPGQGDKDAHGRNYGLAQDRIGEYIRRSFKLPGHKIWTARTRRGDDADTNAPILGPQIVGKALTSEVPAWFNYTFRLMTIPADELTKQPEKHRLYLTDFIDQQSRGAKGLANSRKPLDGGNLPPFVEPASLVQALAMIDQASSTASAAIRARLKAKGLIK